MSLLGDVQPCSVGLTPRGKCATREARPQAREGAAFPLAVYPALFRLRGPWRKRHLPLEVWFGRMTGVSEVCRMPGSRADETRAGRSRVAAGGHTHI